MKKENNTLSLPHIDDSCSQISPEVAVLYAYGVCIVHSELIAQAGARQAGQSAPPCFSGVFFNALISDTNMEAERMLQLPCRL